VAKLNLKHAEVTGTILNAFYRGVYAELGYGFLEKVYENAMCYELERAGLRVRQQQRIDVYFRDRCVGEYFADLIVEDRVIVELKAAERITAQHEAQLINYLHATTYEVGLILNFGPKADHRRKIFSNSRKITKTNVK
jgi:GxxExxY protein